jgi:hypothetical protein
VTLVDFTKIKSNGKQVVLEWTTPAKGGRTGELIEHRLCSEQPPVQEFTDALDALKVEVGALLEVPAKWALPLRVIGVSINTEEDGRKGYVITALKDLEATNAPAVINTPHLRAQEDDEEQGKFAPASLIELVGEVIERAKDYVGGKRAQLDMFADEKKRKRGPALVEG